MTVADIVLFVEIIGVVALLGRMSDQALYVRSLTLPILLLFIAMNAAFSVTYQVMASIRRGRGQTDDMTSVAIALLRLFICVGVVLCGVLFVCAPVLSGMLDVTPEARRDFTWFLRWTSVASLTIVVPALCSAALRGFGHAKAGAVVTVTHAAVEFSGVTVLGFGADMDLASVPIATSAASVVAMVPGVWLMRRHGLWGKLRAVPWRGEVTGLLRGVGLPVALSYLLLSMFNLGMLWVVTPFGSDTISGFTIASTVQSLIIIPGIQLGAATAIIMNQQRGAGALDGVGDTLRAGLELAFGIYAVIAVVVWLAHDMIGHIASGNSRVVEATSLYLAVIALTYVMQGPVLASLTFLEHVGGGLLAVTLNTIYFAEIVVIGGLITRAVDDPVGLYATAAVCNVVGVIVVMIAIRHVRRLQMADAADAPSTQ